MSRGQQNISPPGLNDEFFRELESGERIVWSTRPMPRVYARGALPMIIIGIPFTAFAAFWIAGATWMSRDSGPIALFFPLFGVPFLLIGLGMLSSPFWMRRRANRIGYVITDRRAIIRVPGRFGSVKVESFHPDRLTGMTRVERADGTGNLIFETFTTPRGSGTATVHRGFMGLANVREAEQIIQSTLLKGRTRSV